MGNSSPRLQSKADSDDDPWASDVSESEWQRQVNASEWARLQSEHANAGYREGVVEGKDRTMQVGFDHGFAVGAQCGSEVGQLVGELRGWMLALHERHARFVEFAERVHAVLADLQPHCGEPASMFSKDAAVALYRAAHPEHHLDQPEIESRARQLCSELRAEIIQD